MKYFNLFIYLCVAVDFVNQTRLTYTHYIGNSDHYVYKRFANYIAIAEKYLARYALMIESVIFQLFFDRTVKCCCDLVWFDLV